MSQTIFFDPRLEIRDPVGTVIHDQYCSGQNSFGNGIRCSFAANLELTDDGSFDLSISDQSMDETGSYVMQVESFPPSFAPELNAFDAPTGETISPGTDIDFLSFYGIAGKEVGVNVHSTTDFFDPRLEVRMPDGSVLTDVYCNGQNSFGNGIKCSLVSDLNSLPDTGIYRLAVSDFSANETGNYTLGLQCVFGDCINPPPPSEIGDNCIEFPNGPMRPDAVGNVQLDTDGDGIGNACDADLDDDCVVNFLDLGLLKEVFFSGDPNSDLNGNGFVNFEDLGTMKRLFFADYTVDSPSGVADICD